MILSDTAITWHLFAGELTITPIEQWQIQPASVDLRLGNTFMMLSEEAVNPLDKDRASPWAEQIPPGETFTLHPGDFALATTLERVDMPNDLVGRIEGKSSLGRLGMFTHVTAGFIDPGFAGRITLELYNASRAPLILTPGMAICQLSLHQMDAPAERPYGHPELKSKYQGQTSVTASRYGQ